MRKISELPFAHGGPPLSGLLRASAEDFIVDEDLGFVADGTGEHVFLRIEKRGANTEFVARELASFAGIGDDAVSFAGMKDRHAVARQTFSLHMPGKRDPDWTSLVHSDFHVIEVARHSRKLKRGALKGNSFQVVLRSISGDRDAVGECVEAIRAHGVPNFFGEQRFGRNAENIERARALFNGRRVARHERGVLLSAARSQIFNTVLAARVERANWNEALPGEVWMLAGSHSIFGPEEFTDALAQRLADGDIAPTGPMWGEGELRSTAVVAEIEQTSASQDPALAAGLVANGLRQERRSLVLRPGDFAAEWIEDAALKLSFHLGAGNYATAVLREICDWTGLPPSP